MNNSDSIRYAFEEVNGRGRLRGNGTLAVSPLYFSNAGSSRKRKVKSLPVYIVERKHHRFGWLAVPGRSFDTAENAQAYVATFGGRARKIG